MENFKKSQSKFVTMIDNSFAHDKLPHAIMIEGNSTFLLDKAVNYITTRILSEDQQFDEYIYQRVLEHQFSDVIEFDLSDKTLKKENVLEIQKRFSKTALEKTNRQIYIIKYIENASSIVLNALLKFIEEPNDGVYAIFTTLNTDKVLETIVSRTMNYRLVNNDIAQIKEIYYQDFEIADVDLVALITHDEVIIENTLTSETLEVFKNSARRMFSNILEGNFYLVTYETLHDLSKEDLKIYFELYYACLTNPEYLLHYGIEQRVIDAISAPGVYEQLLDICLSARLKLETNVNKELLVDDFAIRTEGVRA